jgi:ribonuclease HI
MYLEEYNRFKDISIRHIRGHIGVKGNERVDRLAKKGYKEALKRLKK